MMDNSSCDFFFVLHGLNETRASKHMYFAFGLLVYLFTLFVNVLLLITIILDKMLHEPMYLFVGSLYVNGICGSTAFYPKFLVDLLSDSPVISYYGCMVQICVIYWYVFSEMTCLTAMAYDRYVAICKPLEYHYIMTRQKALKLLLFSWIFPLIESSLGTALTARQPFCSKYIDKLYCSNWEVVKLSCTDVTVNNVYGYILMFIHGSQFVFIVVSYIRIIRVTLRSKAQQVKFMQTCLPHLISLMTFTLSLIFDAIYARYGKNQELQALRNFFGMEFLIVPPLLNPIIYGMRLTKIRQHFVKIYGNKREVVRQK